MIVHPAESVERVGELGGLGVQRCTRCGERLGVDSVVATRTAIDVTCQPRDPEALRRAQLRDLLDAHQAARRNLERAQYRVDDAWAAVQRFLAGVS